MPMTYQDAHAQLTRNFGYYSSPEKSLDFRVPTNHSLNRYADFPFSSEISKREVDSFFLLVLLTGLKPHLDKNTSEYEKPGHQRNLHLLVQTINSQPPVSAQLLNRNYNLTC